MTAKFSAITLNGLRLSVHLGCEEEERRRTQFVRFDVRVKFSKVPQGSFTDHLSETVCYAELSNIIRQVCERQEYHLIEKLGWTVYQAIKELIGPENQVWIRTTKENPPIQDPLVNGASFYVGDWNEF